MIGKIWKYINILITIVFVLTTSYCAFLAYNVIPFKYLIIFLVAFLIVLIVDIVSIIKKFEIIKILSLTLSILFIIVSVFISYYVVKTAGFIRNSYNNGQIETYYLGVLIDKGYDSIDDLEGLKIGTFYNNLRTYNIALNSIKKEIEYDITKYEDLDKLYDALLNNEVEAILISESSKEKIEEDNELVDIQIKYIYNASTKSEINDIAKDIDVVNNPFAIYISGIDTYGDIETVSRSDVNIVIIVNPSNKKILLVTIPRDYYVQLYNTTGLKDKLTHAGYYGIETSVKTIESLLDIDINYYLKINFTTLVNAVDVIGGVNVYSKYTFDGFGYQFYEGYNYMNGSKALGFSRTRYNLVGGDRTRGENQLRVIEGIINKLTSSRVLISNYLEILKSLDGTFQTNIDDQRIYDLVKFQLYYMPNWTIEKVSLNGYDSSNYTYSYSKEILYVMEPDVSTINNAKEKIKEVLNTSN